MGNLPYNHPSMTQVKDNLSVLKKAQEIDREVYLAQEQLKEIPQQKAQLKQELELERSHLKDLDGALKKLQLAQKTKEGELAQKEANVKKLDGQLGQVKTNKEYAALQQEIASLKADNSLLEEEIIRLLDETEAAHDEVKKESERLKQCEKESSSKEAELNQKEKSLQQAVEKLKSDREQFVSQVLPEIRSLYEAVIQKKSGLALAKVNGETCSACQIKLRAQLLNEILMGKSIILCENCSRILYVEE